MKISELTNDEFQMFIDTYPLSSIYQTVEYALLMNTEGFDSILLGLKEKEKVLAASVFLIEKGTKYKIAYAPRGFLIDYTNPSLLKTFTKLTKQYLNKRGIMSIRLNPLCIKNTYDMKKGEFFKNEAYDSIFKNLKKLGYKHLGYNAYFEAMKPRFVAMIDLNKPYYEIFKNIKKEYRTKIRTAAKIGIKVHMGTERELDYLYMHTQNKYPRDLVYFKNAYKYFNRKNKAAFFYTKLDTVAYLKYMQEEYQKANTNYLLILNKINTDKEHREKWIGEKIKQDKILETKKQDLIEATELLQNNPNGIVTSSVFVIKNKKEVTLFMDGYNPKYKSLNAKHLLIWKLCEKYANEGYKTLHLGGIAQVTLKENKYAGLNQFKLNFNAYAVEYMGDLELVVNHPLYLLKKTISPIPDILKK